MTRLELLDQLEDQGLIQHDAHGKILEVIASEPEQRSDPVYIRILVGIGAWVAALMFTTFLGMFHIFSSSASALAWGASFAVIAALLYWRTRSTFPSQLALAFAFAGNILIVLGVAHVFRYGGVGVVALAHTAVCAAAYIFFRSSIYRFIAPIAVVVLSTIWIISIEAFPAIHILVAAEIALVGGLLLARKRPDCLVPLTYSAACMLPATILFLNITQLDAWHHAFHEPLWPSTVMLSVGLVYLFARLAGGWKRLLHPWLMLATIAILLLGLFTTPGILIAIGLLIAGFAFHDRLLVAVSFFFLPCFLILFYYALNLGLDYKSWVVAGSGGILLLLRWGMSFFPPKEARQ